MTTITRAQLIQLAKRYFGDELNIASNQQVSFEEAYQSLRAAVSNQKGNNLPSRQVHFTSEPKDGDFDLTKLEYK